MAFKNGELLYVCKKDKNWENGLFVLYRGERDGDDLSYHGIPWYEKIITCEYLDSRDTVEFGDQTWCWCSVRWYIKQMQGALNKIRATASWY